MAFPTNNVRYQQVWNFLLFGILSSIDLGVLSFDMWMQFSNQIIHLKQFLLWSKSCPEMYSKSSEKWDNECRISGGNK